VWRVLKLSARAAIWRTSADPPLVGLPVLLGFVVAALAVRIALQLLAAVSWHAFNPYGLNAVVAWTALELAVAGLFVRPAGRATALSAMLVLSILAESVCKVLQIAVSHFASAATPGTFWTGTIPQGAIYAVAVVWWVGAMICVVGSLEWQTRLRLLGRMAALWAALFIAYALIPQAPVFLPPGFDPHTANWWEIAYALLHDKSGNPHVARADVDKVVQAQPALLRAEIASLAPQRKGITDVYALGIAGWAKQDVFIKELDGGLQAIASVLPIKDRTIRLVNNRDTLANIPVADFENFAAAVHAIGNVMDKDEDVLVLLMTSHGEPTGFALELFGDVNELTPEQISSTLDKEGIKNRVVIVSACYSGIFVPPLQNDNTIVMTAADAKNTSFGCAPERDWTYFGDAFFRQSLHPGADFANAFDHARILIEGWELMDRVHPSNPQGWFGPAVVAKLAPYFATNAGQ
jgi:hypothetical protein